MSDAKADQQHDLAETIAELKFLVASPGWKRYSALLLEQVKGRTDGIILAPLSGFDDTFQQEYAKGEAAGLRLALEIMPSLIENLEEDLALLERKQNDS